MSDPFDEFEFKPLTEGLGFHNQAERSAKTTSSARPQAPTKNLSDLLESFATSAEPSLDFLDRQASSAAERESRETHEMREQREISELRAAARIPQTPPQIFQPLARHDFIEERNSQPEVKSAYLSDFPAPGTKAGSQNFSTPNVPLKTDRRTSLEEGFARAFPHADKQRGRAALASAQPLLLIETAPNWIAAGLDTMVTVGLSTLLLVLILAITKADLLALLGNAATDEVTLINLGLLLLAVQQMYMLVSRAFFGATMGEWAFDMQLGRIEQQSTASYPFKVVLRTLLVTGTGLVVLPLLSTLFGRDVASWLCGVQLYRRK